MTDTETTRATAEPDFRVRVAREKRERMRQRLLNAIMAIGSAQNGRGPDVIDDVIREAKVSRGTFYKYFDSLDEAMAALGQNLMSDIVHTLVVVLAGQSDPARRICTAVCAMMIRASIDPTWGGFVSHIGGLSDDSPTLRDAMRHNIEEGRRAGQFTFDNVEVALDFHLGLTIQAVRRISRSAYSEAYALDVAALALSGLGMDSRKAAVLAEQSIRDLALIGPAQLPWWRSDYDRSQPPA